MQQDADDASQNVSIVASEAFDEQNLNAEPLASDVAEHSSDSFSLSQSSAQSREAEISIEEIAFLKSSVIQPHFKIVDSEGDEPGKLIYILQFGNDRPATRQTYFSLLPISRGIN